MREETSAIIGIAALAIDCTDPPALAHLSLSRFMATLRGSSTWRTRSHASGGGGSTVSNNGACSADRPDTSGLP